MLFKYGVFILSALVCGTALSQGSAPAAQSPPSKRVEVDGKIMASTRTDHTEPVYPALAKQAHISGTVTFRAIISAAGEVVHFSVISANHPLLIQAAEDAVQQFRYQPFRLDGQAVEVETTIVVSFTLPKEEGAVPPKPQSVVPETPKSSDAADTDWVKAQQASFDAIDPTLAAEIIHLLDATGQSKENIKASATADVIQLHNQIAAKLPAEIADRDQTANQITVDVIKTVDPVFVQKLLVRAYSQNLTREQIEAALAFFKTPLGSAFAEAQVPIVGNFSSAVREYQRTVLIPEINAGIKQHSAKP